MIDINVIPRLAVSGMRRNFSAYCPYVLATSICVCIFYILSSIQQNPIMTTLPHAGYVGMLMVLGEILLGIILMPFLISVNKFLIKQRKREIGLYSVLGLEKKHIGFMLAIETVILYVVSTLLGIITATVFSKLIFMFLVKITHLPTDTEFTFSGIALTATVIYFGVIAIANLAVNLFQVSSANPTELFQATSQGEKEPKHIVLSTIAGLATLIGGYVIALCSQMNTSIFTDFFFAVLLVVIGTHLLFKCGSVSFLKACRKNKSFYYKSRNFVSVSGMLYRMKKNASGLANICIFGTMTIITLLCTAAVFTGEEGAVRYAYPNDYYCYFNSSEVTDFSAYTKLVEDTSEKYGMTISDMREFEYRKLKMYVSENVMSPDNPNMVFSDSVRAITLDDYNRTQNKNAVLEKDEILIFCSSANYAKSDAIIDGKSFKVKEELEELNLHSKNVRSIGNEYFYIVFSDKDIIDEISADYEFSNGHAFVFNYDGENTGDFVDELGKLEAEMPGYNIGESRYAWELESYALIGGLLFLGLFFGLVFIICTVLIMYYKQISEGYEDKKNFEIMQKVGMSDKEVRRTISRQILTVFFLPLAAAVIHTAIAVNIVSNLLSAIQIYNVPLIILCAGVTILIFAVIYALSYIFTAKAYYRIVK